MARPSPDLSYHPGFGSEISSEALPHALPKGQVSCCKLRNFRLINYVSYFRIIRKYVPTVCIVSSSPAPPLHVPARPTNGGALLIEFVVCPQNYRSPPCTSWLYRVRPSIGHEPYQPLPHKTLTNDFNKCAPNPNQVGMYTLHCRPLSNYGHVSSMCLVSGH